MTVTEETPRSRTARESAARTYAHALPIVPVRARGLTIEGADGRRYLDCLSGSGTLPLGHNHPVVLEAIRRVLDSGAPLQVPDLSTPVEEDFVAELLRTLPPGLADHARVRFCGPSRASALADAHRLVRAATGGAELLNLGPTRTGAASARTGPADMAAHDPEMASRWPRTSHPAGVIVPSVLDDDRVTPTPDTWTRHVRRLTTAHAVPLIADETETGVGRTGTFWGVEHSGITPDVMVLSKAIGGSLPLSLVVHHTDLHPGAPTSTVRGNQLAMAAGRATLAYVRENHLAERAATLGRRLLTQLGEVARHFPFIGDVRGRGLLLGIGFVAVGAGAGARDEAGAGDVPGSGTGTEVRTGAKASTGTEVRTGTMASTGVEAGTGARAGKGARDVPWTAAGPDASDPRPPAQPLRTAASELAASVQRECLRRGLIVGLTGSDLSIVRLLPPLTISDEQAAAVIDRLSDAVEAAAGAHAPA
ncbi:Acetylornithine_succinyldiaminopimelate aminotransferase [Streptomyces sp. enrichment culture]